MFLSRNGVRLASVASSDYHKYWFADLGRRFFKSCDVANNSWEQDILPSDGPSWTSLYSTMMINGAWNSSKVSQSSEKSQMAFIDSTSHSVSDCISSGTVFLQSGQIKNIKIIPIGDEFENKLYPIPVEPFKGKLDDFCKAHSGEKICLMGYSSAKKFVTGYTCGGRKAPRFRKKRYDKVSVDMQSMISNRIFNDHSLLLIDIIVDRQSHGFNDYISNLAHEHQYLSSIIIDRLITSTRREDGIVCKSRCSKDCKMCQFRLVQVVCFRSLAASYTIPDYDRFNKMWSIY